MTLLDHIQQFEAKKTKELEESYKQKGFKASGNWPRQLQWVNKITPFSINLKLMGADYTDYMINGRGPTSENATAGEPNLLTIIQKWIRDKGLSLNAYAVTQDIHDFGTRQFWDPDPNKKRLITDVFPDDAFDSLIEKIKQDRIQKIRVNIQNTFK